MQKIDSHQHFWKYNPIAHSWINDDMAVIRRDFLPGDLEPILQRNNIDGCVAVQADQTEQETNFLLDLADQHSFIKGVVGWVDLKADDIEEKLAYYKQFKNLKGFRHILQAEADRACMLAPEFKRGIAKLTQFNYTYDILVYPDQLSYVKDLVAAFPDQPFVIDHIAKPNIKADEIDVWAKSIQEISAYQNVFCKISGMVTEADWNNWQPQDIFPYMDVVFDTFGIERTMYGSDWPVCLVAATYEEVLALPDSYIVQLSTDEQAKFRGANAVKFYGLTN
jgi:L-fuconolactonase